MMRKLFFVLIACGAAAVFQFAGNASSALASQNSLPGNPDSLYRFKFNKASMYLSEGPDGCVLITSKPFAPEKEEILRYDPADHSFTQIIEFNGPNGLKPCYQLAVLQDSHLVYGVTKAGGAMNRGLLYSLDVKTGQQTILYDFSASGTAKNPVYGLRKIDAHTLLGVITVDSCQRIFTFDIRTRLPKYHAVSANGINFPTDLPVLISDSICAFLYEVKYSFRHDDSLIVTGHTESVSIVEYNLFTGKVTSAVTPPFKLKAGDLVKAKDGCLYVSNMFGGFFGEEPDPDFLFARYDPATKK